MSTSLKMRNPSGFVKNQPSDLSDGVDKPIFCILLAPAPLNFTSQNLMRQLTVDEVSDFSVTSRTKPRFTDPATAAPSQSAP